MDHQAINKGHDPFKYLKFHGFVLPRLPSGCPAPFPPAAPSASQKSYFQMSVAIVSFRFQ